MTELIWKKRKDIQKFALENQGMDYVFDFPDYADLPRYIADRLSPEAVDAMQYIWEDVVGITERYIPLGGNFCRSTRDKKKDCFKRLSEFRSRYKDRLFDIGEKVGR